MYILNVAIEDLEWQRQASTVEMDNDVFTNAWIDSQSTEARGFETMQSQHGTSVTLVNLVVLEAVSGDPSTTIS